MEQNKSQEIEKIIKSEFPQAKLVSCRFEDSGCEGGKIEMSIVDHKFKDMSFIERHKLIYQLLKIHDIKYHSISLNLKDE